MRRSTPSTGTLPVEKAALAIFTRYPRLGQVKTRLRASLGADGCLRLHRALLLDTIERTGRLDLDRHLFLADSSEDESESLGAVLQTWGPVGIHRQSGADLGERMSRAFEDLLATYDRVICVGTDSPNLPLDRIESAVSALDRFPLVVGPTSDGGYYLLGISQFQPEVFVGIDWGTSRVLDQTLARVGSDKFQMLEPWYDVDIEEDLYKLRDDLWRGCSDFPARTCEVVRSLLPSLADGSAERPG